LSAAEQRRHERLCAHLFGELPEDELRELERDLASHPELAEEQQRLSATLNLVQDALAEAVPEDGLSLESMSSLRHAATRTAPPRRAGAALPRLAAAASVVLCGWLGWQFGEGSAAVDMGSVAGMDQDTSREEVVSGDRGDASAAMGRLVSEAGETPSAEGAWQTLGEQVVVAEGESTGAMHVATIEPPPPANGPVEVPGSVQSEAPELEHVQLEQHLKAGANPPTSLDSFGSRARRALPALDSDELVADRSPLNRAAGLAPSSNVGGRPEVDAQAEQAVGVLPQVPAERSLELVDGLADLEDLERRGVLEGLLAETRALPGESPAEMYYRFWGERPFEDSESNNRSSFSLAVDTQSYELVRDYLEGGQVPPPSVVRTEALVNHFDAEVPAPQEGDFALHMELAPTPFGGAGGELWGLRVVVRARDEVAQQPVARQVAIEVEFDPSLVKSFRLLGFEEPQPGFGERLVEGSDADWVLAGHEVTALYEIEPRGLAPASGAELARASLGWALPPQDAPLDASSPRGQPAPQRLTRSFVGRDFVSSFEGASHAFRRAWIAAQFAELLRGSRHAWQDAPEALLHEARALDTELDDDEFHELVQLVERAAALGLPPQFAGAADPLQERLEELRDQNYVRALAAQRLEQDSLRLHSTLRSKVAGLERELRLALRLELAPNAVGASLGAPEAEPEAVPAEPSAPASPDGS